MIKLFTKFQQFLKQLYFHFTWGWLCAAGEYEPHTDLAVLISPIWVKMTIGNCHDIHRTSIHRCRQWMESPSSEQIENQQAPDLKVKAPSKRVHQQHTVIVSLVFHMGIRYNFFHYTQCLGAPASSLYNKCPLSFSMPIDSQIKTSAYQI